MRHSKTSFEMHKSIYTNNYTFYQKCKATYRFRYKFDKNDSTFDLKQNNYYNLDFWLILFNSVCIIQKYVHVLKHKHKKNTIYLKSRNGAGLSKT